MAPKDLQKGVELRKAAEAALAEADFDVALDKAKEAADLLEDGGEEEVNVMCVLSSAYAVTGKPKLAIDKAKAAVSMGETVGAGAKKIAMLALVRAYLGYKVVPAAILSSEAAMLSLKGSVGPAAAAVTEAVKAVPAIDVMSPSVDSSVLAEAMDDATKVAEDALALFKEAGDKKGEATALYLSTYIKSEKRLLRDALPALEEVQKLFKDAGATKDEELVIKDILSYHLGKADSEAANKLKSDVMGGDKKAGAAALIRVMADTYFTMKELDEAQKLVMEALAMFRGASDKDGEVGGLRAVVNCHLAKGELDDALGVADQIVGKVDDKKKKAGAMYVLASIQLSKDDGLSEAVAALGKVRSFFKDAGASAGEAEALMATAELQLANGDVDAAVASAKEASSVASDASMQAKTLLTVANASMAGGDVDSAGKAATEAQAKAKEAGNKVLEVNALRSIAEVKLAKGDSSGAIETATDMYTMASESGNTLGEANAKLILASAVLSTDVGSQEGLRMGREALALFDAAGDTFGTANTLYMLANGCFANADLEEGLKFSREALAIFRSTKDVENEEILKQIIEEARSQTAEYRKQAPKRPLLLPAGSGPPPSTGASACPISDSRVPKELLEPAVAARKYWGIPKMVQNDPTVDAIERAPSHAIIFGQNLQDNIATQVCVEFGDLVATMAKGDVAKIPIVVTTQGVNGRMTGEHIPHHITGVSSVTIWGMVRTVRQEIPQVQCLLLDFSGAQTTAQIPRNLRMPPMVAESAYYHGARWEPQLAQVPSLFRRELKRDNLTGGGGGSNMGDPKKAAKFMRRSFNWTGPTHKLDYAWYRQEWRAVGAAAGDIGPMPPQQPCRAMRTV